MDLSIVIISYNTQALTKACIESVFAAVENNRELMQLVELIVVDNDSNDDSLTTLRELKKSSPIPFALHANTANVGFAGANNQAILHAKGEYVLLLNSDTVLQSHALESLIKTMEDDREQELGIVAASLLNSDGSPQPQGGDLPSLRSLFVFAFLLDDLPLIGSHLPSHQHTGRRFKSTSSESLELKGWVGGTALLLRSSLVPQIGLLDDQIFMYAEDIEYCWRAQKAGWLVAIDHQAKVIHHGSKSSSSAKAYSGEFISLKYVLHKHFAWWQQGLALLLLKTAVFNRFILFSLLQNAEKANVYRLLLSQL